MYIITCYVAIVSFRYIHVNVCVCSIAAQNIIILHVCVRPVDLSR